MSSRGTQRRRSPFARAGLDPDRAVGELIDAELVDAEDPDPGAAVGDLLELASSAADPQDAFVCLTRLAGNHPELFARVRADEAWIARIAAVAGASRPLGDLLSRFEDAVLGLRSLDPVHAADIAARVEEALGVTTDDEDRPAAVAAIRRRATADIAARDLTGALAVEDVARELAALARGVLQGTLVALHRAVAGDSPKARIAVIGMGKLGGEELNYVSDVDVVFVHAPVEDADEAEAAGEARAVLEELLRVLNASTTMGRAYEIDPTLRPEGRAGPLSRTVDSFVSYWERWAETWEFQALLKARPVAGDLALGAELLARAEPFVYPPELDPGVVSEVRRMKGRVEAKPEVRRHGQRQVKLGPGGIRDIEFAVQLLQLVHGRADRSLRHPGTLPTLAALAEGGYVAVEDAETFADAYRTLRAVEHRLQLAAERRTHTIPDDDGKQERIARSLGYVAEGDRPAREAFMRDLRQVQAGVREIHTKLFFRPLLESHAAVSVPDAELAQRGLDDAAARERLTALGFRDARNALADVRALTGGVSRTARTLQVVLPPFLQELQEQPDPDTGLKRFRDLVESQSSNTRFLGRLRDHPPTVSGLARVFGTSEVAAELLAAQPEQLGAFDEAELNGDAPARAEIVELMRARLAWQDPMAALRRLKRQLLLRTILRDLLMDITPGRVGVELTTVAEALLDAGLQAVLTEVALEEGVGRAADLPIRMIVVGMGKLGGTELHYCSDLDVMFVHEPVAGADRSRAHELANRVAERLMAALGEVTAEGTAFEMDADLRPEGRSGPLSRSLESYAAYYDRWSEPWEHQALVRARPVAGDRGLAQRFVELTGPLAYPDVFTRADVQRMRSMKARMEKERIRSRRDPKRHIKLGPGGLSDVEWTVQLLQQRHGAGVPILRTPSTMGALDAIEDAGLLDHRDVGWLRDGYQFLTRVRNRLYLLRHRNVDLLPSGAAALTRLAHSLGYGRTGRQAFEDDHLRHARHVRSVVERVFYEIPERDRGGWDRA